jgi:hypothetical protein
LRHGCDVRGVELVELADVFKDFVHLRAVGFQQRVGFRNLARSPGRKTFVGAAVFRRAQLQSDEETRQPFSWNGLDREALRQSADWHSL